MFQLFKQFGIWLEDKEWDHPTDPVEWAVRSDLLQERGVCNERLDFFRCMFKECRLASMVRLGRMAPNKENRLYVEHADQYFGMDSAYYHEFRRGEMYAAHDTYHSFCTLLPHRVKSLLHELDPTKSTFYCHRQSGKFRFPFKAVIRLYREHPFPSFGYYFLAYESGGKHWYLYPAQLILSLQFKFPTAYWEFSRANRLLLLCWSNGRAVTCGSIRSFSVIKPSMIVDSHRGNHHSTFGIGDYPIFTPVLSHWYDGIDICLSAGGREIARRNKE